MAGAASVKSVDTPVEVMANGGVTEPVGEDAHDAALADGAADDMLLRRAPGLDAVVRVGGWRQWVRGSNSWRLGAVGLIGLGMLAGAWVVWGKLHPEAEIVVAKPVPVEEAKRVDAEVIQPPKGVVLHRVHGDISELTGPEGGVALTVRGLLTNTSSNTVVVPALRLELLGNDGKVADLWPVSGVSGTLAPQAEQAWTVSLSAPDMRAIEGWRVVFIGAKK